jgi:hypothetical protein
MPIAETAVASQVERLRICLRLSGNVLFKIFHDNHPFSGKSSPLAAAARSSFMSIDFVPGDVLFFFGTGIPLIRVQLPQDPELFLCGGFGILNLIWN